MEKLWRDFGGDGNDKNTAAAPHKKCVAAKTNSHMRVSHIQL